MTLILDGFLLIPLNFTDDLLLGIARIDLFFVFICELEKHAVRPSTLLLWLL
jgi:hypothetical protein